MSSNKLPVPLSYGVLLYPEFEVLDMAGPVEVLNTLARQPGFEQMSFSYIAKSMDPVTPGPIGQDATSFAGRQRYLPTHTFDNAPQLDVLLVPGGYGSTVATQEAAAYIHDAYTGGNGKSPLKYLVTVCSGSGLAAEAGVLDGHHATTNKEGWEVFTKLGPATHWVAQARWVVSGNIWTASGVSAGIDCMFAWLEAVSGTEIADKVAHSMEYIRSRNPGDDPFAASNRCEDILPQSG